MHTAIANERLAPEFVAESSSTEYSEDLNAEIDRAFAPARGTVYGLLLAAVAWSVFLTPVWFFFPRH